MSKAQSPGLSVYHATVNPLPILFENRGSQSRLIESVGGLRVGEFIAALIFSSTISSTDSPERMATVAEASIRAAKILCIAMEGQNHA